MPSPERPSFRWPAEWEPLDAVWVVPPHNPETWPGCLEEAQAEHAVWRKAMAEVVAVRTPGELGLQTDDSWIRDYGPLFVHNTAGELVAHDFRFNAWGGKYDSQLGDDAVAEQLTDALGVPGFRHEQILEGGALDTNGQGVLLTTTDCLLSPSRHHDERSIHDRRQAMEQLLRDTLGISQTIWLSLPPGGLPGDDTDGHVDNAARFITPDTVAIHPVIDPAPLRDAGLNVVVLPTIPTMTHDYPADDNQPAGSRPLPASYANFVIANGRVFVPTFGQPSDDDALRLLDDAMPDHTPVPIRANHLVVGLGALHCLSMQQPAPAH